MSTVYTRAAERAQGASARDRIVRAVAALTARSGYPPTVRELGDHLGGLSTGHLHYHLRILRHEGRVAWEPGLARSLRALDPAGAPACAECARLARAIAARDALIGALTARR